MRQAMEFKGSQGFVAPQTVAILGTYDENGVPNAMNAAWCMQSDTAELSISLGTHKTTDNFVKTGAFTVAFATVKTLVISDYVKKIDEQKRRRVIEPASFRILRSRQSCPENPGSVRQISAGLRTEQEIPAWRC